MQSTLPAAAPPADPASLAAAFAAMPDPRRAASIVYPLSAMLALVVTALLANQHSVLAIAYGRRVEIAPRWSPATSMMGGHRASRRCTACCDGSTMRPSPPRCAAAWPRMRSRGQVRPSRDGKAQRGRLRFADGGDPATHTLRAFNHDTGLVLAHESIAAGADKAAAELTVAPMLLARIVRRGRDLTGDALFCRRALCRQVLAVAICS